MLASLAPAIIKIGPLRMKPMKAIKNTTANAVQKAMAPALLAFLVFPSPSNRDISDAPPTAKISANA